MKLASLCLTAVPLASLIIQAETLQPKCLETRSGPRVEPVVSSSRRWVIAAVASSAGPITALLTARPGSANAVISNGLTLTSTASGLKWVDAKVGSGPPVVIGNMVSIDYSMASTAGRFPQIYTTKDTGAPYRWQLGDGSTILGIERAILGDATDQLPPMRPGGIRRVIIPAELGYQQLMSQPNAKKCAPDNAGSIGPIPPKDGSGAYQRWVQFYCNPRIPYQPDLVVDIKLYGKRN
jgi:FKBP-type peptidyl-prolyl cis-trans isomerase